LRTLIVAVAIATLPAAASAGPLTISLQGMGQSEYVVVGGKRLLGTNAGEIKWAQSGISGLDPEFYSYCVDLLSNAETTQSVFAELVTGSAVGWLYNQFSSAAHLDSAMAAGLQLAIWNVLYDNDYSVDLQVDKKYKNNFYLISGSAGARNYANSFLKDLSYQLTLGALGGSVLRFSTYDLPGQDQIARAPVPEPGTLLLLGSGVAALAARRKFRKNAQQKRV
jgi:PEP-CTERM motif